MRVSLRATPTDATGGISPTHGIADGGELPVLLRAHVLAVAGFEGHPPTPPLNLKLCVDLPEEKSQLGKKNVDCSNVDLMEKC